MSHHNDFEDPNEEIPEWVIWTGLGAMVTTILAFGVMLVGSL